MDFKPALPMLNSRQLEQLVSFCKTVDPQEAGFDEIESVFTWIGRCLLMPCPVPSEAVQWAICVPRMRLLACEVICQAVISNATHVMARRLESALFALVALRDFMQPNAQTFQQLAEEAARLQPETKDNENGNR